MPEGARQVWLSDRVDRLKTSLGAQAARTRPSVNTDERFALYHRLAKLSSHLAQAQNTLAKVEADLLRPLVLELRDFARRNNLTLARPIWPPAPQTQSASFVYFAGSSALHQRIARVAVTRGLQVSAQSYPGAEPADARWRDLNAASVAAFDLSDEDPQVYYDLGTALSLGRELLLMARAGTRIPFDVEQDVLEYPADGPDDAFLGDAVDGALYAVTPGAGALGDVMHQLEEVARASTSESAKLMLSEALNAKDDPVALHALLSALLPMVGDARDTVQRPRWPCPPLGAHERSCFIVMPFRAELKPTHTLIESRVKAAGLVSVRGDQPPEQDIVERIWAGLVRADRVIVDLSGFNLNVCLELGIAHTLGRPTLLIGQRGTEESLFSSIAKLECHGYDLPVHDDRSFARVLDRFLA